MSADYSQIELRLLAHFSQDQLLLNAFRTGQDIHTLTAAEVFGVDAATMDKETRNRAKAVNFGIVYGSAPSASPRNWASIRRPQSSTSRPTSSATRASALSSTRPSKPSAATGRPYALWPRPSHPRHPVRNPNMRGFAERTAVNTPLQGTAADLIKIAMLRIDQLIRDRKLRSRMTLQVHDELLFDVVPEESNELQQLVKQEMEHVEEFSVPIIAEVGIGQNWRDIK